MTELIVDFITSLDGYASAEGWPGFWGVEAPEYLAWLDQRPDRGYTLLMGANTYRLMYGFTKGSEASGSGESAEQAPWPSSRESRRSCSPQHSTPPWRGPIQWFAETQSDGRREKAGG
jgi:hypothetical protein